MPLSAPEYWLEWAKNYFRCQFTYVGELIHKETWSSASFGWAEGLQTINPPIYRLTTAVSDIDQTNINRDIRDGNWLSNRDRRVTWTAFAILAMFLKVASVPLLLFFAPLAVCPNFSDCPHCSCSTGLHKLWHPGILVARKWREKEVMERELLSTFPHSPSISFLSPFPSSKSVTFYCKMLNSALLSQMSQKS